MELAAKLFAMVLSLIGPAPKDTPATLQLKAGDSIVCIGDSITAYGGYLRDIDAVLAQQYPDLKIKPVVNAGVSGQHAEHLIKRFQKDVVDRKPTYVTISIGINDVWHRLGRTASQPTPHDANVLALYKENVGKMVDMAQEAGIKVILLTPTLIYEDANNEGNQRLLMYVAAEKEIAAEKKCQLVDLHGMFLTALAKKPAGQSENFITKLKDGVHMNDKGDAIMAIGVLRALGVNDDKIAATEPPAPPAPASRPAKAASASAPAAGSAAVK